MAFVGAILTLGFGSVAAADPGSGNGNFVSNWGQCVKHDLADPSTHTSPTRPGETVGPFNFSDHGANLPPGQLAKRDVLIACFQP